MGRGGKGSWEGEGGSEWVRGRSQRRECECTFHSLISVLILKCFQVFILLSVAIEAATANIKQENHQHQCATPLAIVQHACIILLTLATPPPPPLHSYYILRE